MKVVSCGEPASDGVYTFDKPASFKGNYYPVAETYFQIQMRYVYDYDWIRVKQGEWSNVLEVNPELSDIDLEKAAAQSATTTTLLWIGGGVLLVVLAVVVLSGGDVRCPECRCRVPKKAAVCPKCGHDMKAGSKKSKSTPKQNA